jgi:neopullulanase
MKRSILLSVLIALTVIGACQSSLEVYPGHWWVGMKNHNLQVMLHQKDIAKHKVQLEAYPGVKLVKVNKVENPNYLFVDLVVSPAAIAGNLHFNLAGGNPSKWNYELMQRRKGNGTIYAQGVRSSDLVYLIMPDRFSDGDYSNDRIQGMKDQSLNRDSMYARHGGDIQGVINHLDYLKELGITTVWLTPVMENDMRNRTEHGYAITNFYKVDPRQGTPGTYKRLSDELHKRGMKLIQDAVYNHCGLQNFFVQDMPMKSWLHQWPQYTNTTYKDQPLMDSYASVADQKVVSDGWFTRQMPDLNQSNPFLANYLIQNAIYSVEEYGVDGWRIDTYIYNDLPFMNRCNKALMDEYPKITMFGETWVHGVLNQAFFTENNLQNVRFKSNLPGVTDFQTNFDGINPALTQPFGWTEGVNRLYQTLSKDFVYQHPMNHTVFLDNHDMSRFYSQVNENIDKLKVGIGWLMTTRGVPELYYGTEILMKGISNPDGLVRGDFPGGWKEDKQNKFTAAGRTDKENEVFNWTKTLANFRKSSSAIKTGKLMQYVPEEGVYTYFRYDRQQTVMVVMNTTDKENVVKPSRFNERTVGFTKAKNVVTSAVNDLQKEWDIPSYSIWVLELMK